MTTTVPADVFAALTSPDARRDPYPTHAAYRTEMPLLDTGLGLWFVFGFHDCLALLRSSRTSVDERHATIPGPPKPDEPPTLIHLDPPDHDRLRRLVQVAFTPRRVEGLRRRATEIVTETLDRFGPDDEVDVIQELAYPMPLTIICELLDIDPSERDLVREWSTWMARSIDPGVFRSPELNDRIELAEREFSEFVRDGIERRRRRPGDDLLSQLVTTELDGDRLSEDELVGLAVLLLVAGHETTVNLIGNGLHALLRHPDQLAAVAGGATPDRRMIDELLRFDAPVQMTSRVTLDPIELPSGTIPKGQVAIVLLGSANHDPSVFVRPDELDVNLEREAAHLAFGNGIHFCLGAALARAEGEIALGELVRRFPRMQLAAEPPLRPTFVLRGREELRVRLS